MNDIKYTGSGEIVKIMFAVFMLMSFLVFGLGVWIGGSSSGDGTECACLCECPEVAPSQNYYEYRYNLAASGGGATICMDDQCEYRDGELRCNGDDHYWGSSDD